MPNELNQTWRLTPFGLFTRWGGFMLCWRDEREAFGRPGSQGRSYKLTVWRNQ